MFETHVFYIVEKISHGIAVLRIFDPRCLVTYIKKEKSTFNFRFTRFMLREMHRNHFGALYIKKVKFNTEHVFMNILSCLVVNLKVSDE